MPSLVINLIQLYTCVIFVSNLFERRITDKGLRNAYLNNEAIRKMLKLPQVLSFVPVEDVVTTVEQVNVMSSGYEFSNLFTVFLHY